MYRSSHRVSIYYLIKGKGLTGRVPPEVLKVHSTAGVRHLQTADLQTADLQTCRLADLYNVDQPMDFCDIDKPCDAG